MSEGRVATGGSARLGRGTPWRGAWLWASALLGCSVVQSQPESPVIDIARPKQPAPTEPPESESDRPTPERFAGTFVGTLMSNGQLVRVTTEFDLDDGELSGHYWFGEADREEGSLTDCSWQGSGRVTCTWSDAYGEGPLVMNFDLDGAGFRGSWASQEDPASTSEWNGERSYGGDF